MNKINEISLEDSKTIDHGLNLENPKRQNGGDQDCKELNQELVEDDYAYESEDDEEEEQMMEQYAKVILFGSL